MAYLGPDGKWAGHPRTVKEQVDASKEEIDKAQAALQDLADSVEWWEEATCLCRLNTKTGLRLDIVCPKHDNGEKVLRYPKLFEAVFSTVVYNPPGEGLPIRYFEEKPYSGYRVRSAQEFWWLVGSSEWLDKVYKTLGSLDIDSTQHGCLAFIGALQKELAKIQGEEA